MENKETIFRVGDKVYDANHGWGKIVEYANVAGHPYEYPVFVEFSDVGYYYTIYGRSCYNKPPSLSFTEYDYIDGGFSQERPKEGFAELKEAHRNGEEIQVGVKSSCGIHWIDDKYPKWDLLLKYRIKLKEGFMKFGSMGFLSPDPHEFNIVPSGKESVFLLIKEYGYCENKYTLDRQNLEILNNYLNKILEK